VYIQRGTEREAKKCITEKEKEKANSFPYRRKRVEYVINNVNNV
jgi:hypothetical protein